jgi:serine/threonine protein kinase
MSDLGHSLASLSTPDIICTSCGQPMTGPQPRDPVATVGPEDSERTQSCNLVPGTLLAGRYRITALIGHGEMGEVYQADDVNLAQVVALKFLPPHLQANKNALAHFHREVSLTRRISHPNVCRVFDIGYAEGLAFIAMEYVAGDDLRALQERIGRLPYDTAVEVARQLCAGVAAAHAEGVLHRDLKPANIMLDWRGNVRITDFGLATPLGEYDPVTVGTPLYMAPEQLRGQQVSVRTDLYSLGLVLQELFTGKAPLAVASHSQEHVLAECELPAAIKQVIAQCLELDPARRPQSAAAVADALVEHPHSSAGGEAFDARHRFAWLVFAVALVGLAILLGLAMRTALDFGVFDRQAVGARAVLFAWAWCIGAQSFLVFLSVAYLLRHRTSRH